jgi:aldehyde oxidoreductase
MSGQVHFTVNQKKYSVAKEDQRTLIHFLRGELHQTGTKNGCEKGQCGTCSVLIDDVVKKSCIVKLNRLDNVKIETIENLPNDKMLSVIQKAFISVGAVQCGFCTPGMIITTKGLLMQSPDPSEVEIKKAFKNNLCRCTGYLSIIKAIQKAAEMMGSKVNTENEPLFPDNLIGHSFHREDAFQKTSGTAMYADDYFDENMLIGKLKFSDFPHANVVQVDISEAEKMQGVAIVLTAKNVPGRNAFGITIPQQPVFADKKIQYSGDMIAAVFANSAETAQKAVDAIKVEYEVLPVINDPEAAKVTDHQLNEIEGNCAEKLHLTKGDITQGFKDAAAIVEGVYQVPFVEHAYLEPEACFSKIIDGRLVVWTPSQDSFHMLECITKSLDLTQKEVRVVQSVTGGAFGGKQEPTIQIATALASWLTKKPAKITLSREESIRVSTKRHAATINMKHGASADGKLIAFSSETVLDAGAYLSETRWVNFRACVAAAGPYKIPNVETSAYSYYTNNNPTGAFRGFGSTQVCFASEIQMDKLAAELDITPFEIRKRNALSNQSETITGQLLTQGVGFPETLTVIYDRLEKLKQDNTIHCTAGHQLGIGIASSYKNVGIGLGTDDDAGADIELMEGGYFQVRTGSAEMGQGTTTLILQIAAHELGVSYESIQTINGDTDLCPNGGVTTASRQTFITGNAVRLAARKMRSLIQEKSDVVGDWNKSILEKVFKNFQKQRIKPSTSSRFYPPKTFDYRENANLKNGLSPEAFDIHYAYCFTTCAVILEVNASSGAIIIKKIISAQDAGKAINPQMVIGQIEGAVVMGVGYALSENFEIENGIIKSNTLKKLHIPNIQEVPDIESIIIEEPHFDGPYGAKGMGEVPINPVAPAIVNAIYNALGIHVSKIPINPQDIIDKLAQLD